MNLIIRQPESSFIYAAAQETKACTLLLQLYLFFLFMFQTLFRLSDNALDVLLHFLAMFFKSLGKWVAPLPSSFVNGLPSSIYSARKMAGSERDRFDRYVWYVAQVAIRCIL